MFRVSLPRFLAVLVTGLLLATGLQAPADAAVTRYISMTTSASSTTVKSNVTFSGKLTKSPKGSIVYIQRKVGTRWVAAKSTRTTTTTGVYKVAVTMPSTTGTYSFRAYAPAKGTLRAAASGARAVKILNKVVVTATANPMTVPAGSDVTVSGTVKPYVVNSLASVQKLLSGKWTNVGTTAIGSGGTYSKTLSVGPTTQLRVASPLVSYNAVGYSPTITVTTTPVIATQTLPTATRTVAYSAKLITIDGSVGTWTASPLPAGLSLNANTGVISGTPTTVEITSTTVRFLQTSTGLFSPVKTIDINVNEAPKPVITTSTLTTGNRTRPYSMTLAAQGNPAGTWSATPLPDGLSLQASTGVISGTPTTVGTTPVVINFQQSSTGLSAVQRTINLDIAEAPAPVITTSSLPSGKRLSAYSTTLAATVTGTAGGTWSASPLPAGLSINTDTGVISGTPTTVETKQVVITFTQTSTGVSGTRTLPLQVLQADPPVISTTALPNGKRLSPYSFTVTATGNPAGTWAATGLPTGLSIDQNTGEIFGTPTVTFDANVTLAFTQTSTGVTGTKVLRLVVTQADPPVISTTTLPNATIGSAYTTTLATQGNTTGAWTASPLPAGLALNQNTGVISGTPTGGSAITNVVIAFTQASTGVAAANKTIALKVLPGISQTSLTQGTVGTAYSVDLQALDNNQTGTWTAAPLPAGLTLAADTGVISGTPTTAGTTSVVITFKKTSSDLTSAAKTLALSVKPVISTSSLPTGNVGSTYSTTLAANGGTGGTWFASPLPAGLSFDTGTGVISGTPTTAGTTQVEITYTRGGVEASSKTLALAIRPVITTSSLPVGTDGEAYSVTLAATGGSGTWSAAPLPAGLSLNTGTGVISGTPEDAGNTNVVIGYTSNGVAATTKTIQLSVRPVITTASLPGGSVGASYSTTLAGSGTGTWSAAPLPDGLSLNTGTGVISGAPTSAGTTNVVIGLTRNGVAAATKTLALVVKPVISTNSLPAVDVGTAYNVTLTAASGGTGTWSASPLPSGITLDPATGKLTGTPDVVDSTDVVIGFTRDGVAATSKTLTLNVRPVISTGSLSGATVGTAYSAALAGTGDGTWTAAPLPSGLSLDAGTGVISGTPTTAGSTNAVVGYTLNGVAAASKTLALAVKPVITTSSLPDGTVGSSYSVTLAAAGGSGTWTASPLPSGLSLNSGTGVISGTPDNAGTTNVVIGFTSGGQAATTKTLALAVKPVINTSSLPDGTRAAAYSITLSATGAGTWTAAPLPAGLSLNASTGVISGTPTTVGTTNVVIGFTRNGVAAVGKTLSLQINEAPAPVITTTSLNAGTVGTAYSTPNLAATASGDPAGTWDASPLPNGVALSNAGVFSGTPTTAGTTNVVIEFTQTSTGLTATKTLALNVKPVITTSSLATGTAGTAYSVTLAANGGSGTWTASPLPAGLSLNEDTGVITGTPTTAGSTNVVIGFTANGQAATGKTLALAVKPSITTASLPNATAGTAYSTTLVAAGGSGVWTADPLPAGLTLNEDTGVISGTPTAPASTNVVIGFTANGQTATGKTLALAVKPVITTAALTGGTVGSAYSLTLDGTGTGTWSAAPLPDGLTLNTGTGAITGTPTEAGTTNVVIGYTVNGQAAAGKTLTLAVKPVITTSSLPDGITGTAYSLTLATNSAPGTWTASPLPNGLSLNASTGAITGTPTVAGTTSVVIGFTSGGVAATSKTLDLDIKPVITTASLPTGTAGTAYSLTLAATGGSGTWTASPLPNGLSLNASTGAITGTPTAAGTTNVVIGFTSGGVAATSKTLELDVKPVITTALLPVGTVGSAYSVTLDGTGSGTWTASPLPAGLTLNANNGAISGTPTAAGSTSVVIGYTSGGVAATSVTLDLDVKPVISTSALPDGTRTEAYSFTLTATGGTGGTWTASPLPGGLSLNSSTGVISGTPNAVGTTNVVIGYSRGGVAATGKTLALEIVEADPPVITTASLPDGQEGVGYSKQVVAQGNPAGTWSTEDPLPAGLSIDENDGTISGTPSVSGSFTVVVRFEQDSTGLVGSKSFGLVIAPA